MNLHHFLRLKTSAGRLDSEGTFTLDASKAVNKTAAYALADHKHWLLKVIQSAVAWECEKVKIALTRDSIQVELWGNGRANIENLKNVLVSAVAPSVDAASELGLGLKALLSNRRFLVGDRLGHCLSWNGSELSESDQNLSGEGPDLALSVSRRAETGGWIAGLQKRARESQEYLEMLRARVTFAPLELYCDGRRIEHQTEYSSDHLLACRLKDGKLENSDIQLNFYQDRTGLKEPFVIGSPSSGREDSQLHLTLSRRRTEDGSYQHLHLPAPFRVHFGRLGVVCETRLLEGAICGGCAYYELGPKCGDLSGLKLESTFQDWDRHRGTVVFIRECMERLKEALRNPQPEKRPEDREFKQRSGRSGLAKGLVAVPLAVLGLKVLPLTLSVCAVAAGLASVGLSNVTFESDLKIASLRIRTIERFQESEEWYDRSLFQVEKG